MRYCGGVVVAVLFKQRCVRQRVADVHVVLNEIPECERLADGRAWWLQVAEADTDIRIAVLQAEDIHGQALAIWGGIDIGIELMEGGAVFGYFTSAVLENGDHASAAIEFPFGALAGFDPEAGEFVEDQGAEGQDGEAW